jgi:hypothetical protein
MPTFRPVALIPTLPPPEVPAQMPRSGGTAQDTTNQTLREATIVMLLGGVFFAILITVLVVAIWVVFRYLRARELPKAA